MEFGIFDALYKMGPYLCFEVMMPSNRGRGTGNHERVDLLTYETKGYWRFYEFKATKSDFYSSAAKTFLGHYNYYVLPHGLYEQVKADVPDWVGVFEVFNSKRCSCVKKPKLQDLKIKHEDLMFSFMQSLSRENTKYVRERKTKYVHRT